MTHLLFRSICVAVVGAALAVPSLAQTAQPSTPANTSRSASAVAAPPQDYVIGPKDVLSIVFWRDEALTTDVVVRPDGRISLPLLKDVQAAGSTPEQLAAALMAVASKYVTRPNATVIVKEINSRQVFILGKVTNPGVYPLAGPMTVLQLIASAGDLLEYADSDDVVIVRTEGGREQRFGFNYEEVVKGENPDQNVLLKPGDTVIVP